MSEAHRTCLEQEYSALIKITGTEFDMANYKLFIVLVVPVPHPSSAPHYVISVSSMLIMFERFLCAFHKWATYFCFPI